MRVLLMIALLSVISSSVFAALRVTEEEKAVFAFFQLGKRIPDYESWIYSGSYYNETPEDIKKDVLQAEETRLKWGFGTYDHKEDSLKIQTDIELQINEKDGQNFLNFRFPGSAGEEYPYFPYPYKQEWIALVVQDLASFSSIPLNQEQLSGLRPFFGEKTTLPATMKMRIRPKSADLSAPLKMDEMAFWIMGGDIAYIDFRIDDNKLFAYTAPWYLSDEQAELLELLE